MLNFCIPDIFMGWLNNIDVDLSEDSYADRLLGAVNVR
jgi:hypothetical protein